MKKYQKKKSIIISLLVLVVSIGIGFASFSSILNINGRANVSPNESNYKVIFVSSVESITKYDRSDFYGMSSPNTLPQSKGTFTDDTTFTNTGVTFTEDGQSIEYNFYLLNIGKYDAHITNLDIGKKTCTPGEDANQALAASACSSINLSVILGNDDNQTTYTSSQTISNHILPKGTWEPITVKISYPEGSPLVDGSLEVNWQDITLITATTSTYTPPQPELQSVYELPNNFIAEIENDNLEISGVGELNLEYPVNIYLNNITSDIIASSDIENKTLTQYFYSFIMKSGSANIFGDEELSHELYLEIYEDYYDSGYTATSRNEFTEEYFYEVVNDLESKLRRPEFHSISFSDGITSIDGEWAFGGLGLTSVDLSGTITSIIGRNMFEENEITSVTIPENIKYIGSYEFSDNPLQSVTIIGNDKSIDERAFYDISTLTSYDQVDTTQSNFDKTTLLLGSK